MTTAPAPPPKFTELSDSQLLDLVEQRLEMFVENTRQIGIMSADFQPQTQPVLNQKLHGLVGDLQELDKLKGQLAHIQLPLGVLDYIDDGKNPQLFTKDCMEASLSKNEGVKGKIETLNRFRGLLMVELTKTFPNQMAKYRALRDEV